MDVLAVQGQLREFARTRGWSNLCTPKNLAMAVAGEAGELLAEFQWLTPQESQDLQPGTLDQVREEIADVAIYLLQLADVLEVDLAEAIQEKMAINHRKHPALPR